MRHLISDQGFQIGGPVLACRLTGHGTPVAIKNRSRKASSQSNESSRSISFDHALPEGQKERVMSKELLRVFMMLIIIMMVAFASAVVSVYAQF
jgi:hypothetical protein